MRRTEFNRFGKSWQNTLYTSKQYYINLCVSRYIHINFDNILRTNTSHWRANHAPPLPEKCLK